MNNTARACVWTAAACGLVLAAASPSAAGTLGGSYGDDGVSWNRFTIRVESVADCSKRALSCVNGAVDSGNVSNAQNVRVGSNANHSGSPYFSNGSSNVNNETHGPYSKSDDDLQMLGRLGRQHL